MFEAKDYILDRIDGEYAYLKKINSYDEIFISLALLPPRADMGSKIHCECFEYTLIN